MLGSQSYPNPDKPKGYLPTCDQTTKLGDGHEAQTHVLSSRLSCAGQHRLCSHILINTHPIPHIPSHDTTKAYNTRKGSLHKSHLVTLASVYIILPEALKNHPSSVQLI